MLAIPNAIARIVLSTIEHRLSQWTARKCEQIVYGRESFNTHKSKISVLPEFLFEIDWASSAPGFSWPVAYHVGFRPYYDVYVVTSSADSPEASGYLDLALGYFWVDGDITEVAKHIIQTDWQHQFDKSDQQRWEALWRTGLIKTAEVEEMADGVWGKQTQEGFYARF